MDSDWNENARNINDRFMRLAQSKGKLTTGEERIYFLVLAICGESGELANLLKKKWRGDDINMNDVHDEMADIRIYLEHLAECLGIDLDHVCRRKLEEVSRRLDSKEQK